jgi:hypothetical protein
MADYIQRAEDNYFTDLIDDETFGEDLKKFFTGGRYNYSQKEIEEKGVEGLANDFAEHMRYQSTNETTAVKDLLYVQRDYETNEKIPEAVGRDRRVKEGKKAFGRLMQAYDMSAGGGDGSIGSKLEGAGDYLKAFVSSPSTLLTVGTLGTGIFSKIAARGASKATQMSIRAHMSKMLSEGVKEAAVKEKFKKTLGAGAAKGAGAAIAIEGSLGGGMSYASNEARAGTIDDYTYTKGDVIMDGLVSGAFGGVMGGAFGALDAKKVNNAIDITMRNLKAGSKAKAKAKQEAVATITNAKPSVIDSTLEDVVDVVNVVRAKKLKQKLDPLDPEMVKMGQDLKREVLSTKRNKILDSGLDTDTIKSIMAAAIEMKGKLKVGKGQRITSAIADQLRGDVEPTITSKEANAIREKYNLSAEEFSYIFLAELSKAGKLLGEASQVKRVFSNIDVLANHGISSLADREVADIFEAVGGREQGFKNKNKNAPSIPQNALRLAQDTDALRIAFMTSQVGTTIANVTTQGFNTFIDISDQFWKNVLRSTVGNKMPDGTVDRRWVTGTLSNLRGLTMNREEAMVLKDMLMEDAPFKYRDLFYENTRALNHMNSQSMMARAGRLVNKANIMTDAVFKQSYLYASIDRQLREVNVPAVLVRNEQGQVVETRPIGRNFSEFILNGNSVRDLPEKVLDKAIDDAKRFTFQRDYKKDVSLFGRGASAMQQLHRKYPFLISAGADIPFPRYIANHLEYINDYTPIGMVTGGLDKIDELTKRSLGSAWSDGIKTGRDRLARQMTGVGLLLGGIYAAAAKQGEIDFDKLELEGGRGELDMARVAGPWAANLLLGDLIYRHATDKPINPTTTSENIREIMGGVPDIGTGSFNLEFPLIRELVKSVERGEATEGLEKELGSIMATFTYPATIARDVYAQINFDSAGNPYTRPMLPGEADQTDIFGERNFISDIINSEMLKNQATRFLLDSNMFSYNQSRTPVSGKTGYDYKLYSIFNPNAVGSYNPITKQFGMTQEPPSTGLQREITRLNLKDYKLYTNKSVRNSSLAYQVQYNLSQKLPALFEVWRKGIPLGGKNNPYADLTYDELDALPIDPKDIESYKAKFLDAYIKGQIKKEEEAVKAAFEDALLDPKLKKRTIGYIRNQYELITAKFGKVDNVIDRNPDKFDGAETAKEYLSRATDIEDEINRRLYILDVIEEEEAGGIGEPLQVGD